MKQIRIYKDIEFVWSATYNGQTLNLEGMPLRVYIVRPDNTREDTTDTLSVSGAQLTFRYPHERQTMLGVHRLELWANPDTPQQTIADLPGAFCLVALSTMEGGEDPVSLATEHVSLQAAELKMATGGAQAATSGGRHFLTATTSGGSLKLQGDLKTILAEGLVPVLFRKVRRTARSASANNGQGALRRKAGWSRVGKGNLLEVSQDGAVRMAVRVTDEDPYGWDTTGEYTTSAEAYVLKGQDGQKIRWGRNAKRDEKGCTLCYAVGFVTPDYPFEDEKAPFDWAKLRTDLAKFKVARKEKEERLVWVFATC